MVAGAQSGKNAVENNLLSPVKNETLLKALDDQKAGKNLIEASQTIVRLSNEDSASNILVDKYLKGQLTDGEKQDLAGLLDQYGFELQSVYGYSEQQAKDAIQSLLSGKAFVATDANAKAYNEALSYLSMYGVQSGQAALGTDALLVLPGIPGTLVRSALSAGGAYQTGTGIGQVIDGNYGEGALNIGLGTAAIFGGVAGQNITNKAENVLTKGQITYEFGAKPDSNELRAGSTFSQLGYDITYKTTASDKGIKDVRTQDLWVEGIGRVDVYTPQSTKPKSIINTIEKKDSQTSSVLTQVDLTSEEMNSIASRVWGKPNIKNINTLFFQDSTGQVYRFDRPRIGGN